MSITLALFDGVEILNIYDTHYTGTSNFRDGYTCEMNLMRLQFKLYFLFSVFNPWSLIRIVLFIQLICIYTAF